MSHAGHRDRALAQPLARERSGQAPVRADAAATAAGASAPLADEGLQDLGERGRGYVERATTGHGITRQYLAFLEQVFAGAAGDRRAVERGGGCRIADGGRSSPNTSTSRTRTGGSGRSGRWCSRSCVVTALSAATRRRVRGRRHAVDPRPQGSWVGVDADPAALGFSRRRGLRPRGGWRGACPFRGGAFAACLCLDLLYHRNVGSEIGALRMPSGPARRRPPPRDRLRLQVAPFGARRGGARRPPVHDGARRARRGRGLTPPLASYAYCLVFPVVAAVRLARHGRRRLRRLPLPGPLNALLLGVQAVERALRAGRRARQLGGLGGAEGGGGRPRWCCPRTTSATSSSPWSARSSTAVGDVEVLVVDDDSPDRTWEAVATAFAGDGRARALRRVGRAACPRRSPRASTSREVRWWSGSTRTAPCPPRSSRGSIAATAGADVAVASRYAAGVGTRASPPRGSWPRARSTPSARSGSAGPSGTGPRASWRPASGARRAHPRTDHVYGDYCIDFLHRACRPGIPGGRGALRVRGAARGHDQDQPSLRRFAALGLTYARTILRLRWASRAEEDRP